MTAFIGFHIIPFLKIITNENDYHNYLSLSNLIRFVSHVAMMHSAPNTTLPQRSVSPEEARCACGHLIAKLRGDHLELKCKRCKRLVSIARAALAEWKICIAPCGE